MLKPQAIAILLLVLGLGDAPDELRFAPGLARPVHARPQEEPDAAHIDRELGRIYFPAGMEGAADRVAEAVPRLLADARTRLDLGYEETLTIWLERDHDDFNRRMLALGSREKPAHVAAVAFPYRDTILMKAAAWQRGTANEFEVTLQHELVHCMLGSLRRRHPQIDIPTWLDEGIAQWASEPLSRPQSSVLGQAIRRGELIPFEELRRDFPDQEGASALAYAQSLSLVRYLDRSGPGAHSGRNIPDLIVRLRLGDSVEEAVLAVTGLDFEDLEAAWEDETRSPFPFEIGELGEIAFGLSILVLSLLAYATARVRKARRLAEFDAEEERDRLAIDEAKRDSELS